MDGFIGTISRLTKWNRYEILDICASSVLVSSTMNAADKVAMTPLNTNRRQHNYATTHSAHLYGYQFTIYFVFLVTAHINWNVIKNTAAEVMLHPLYTETIYQSNNWPADNLLKTDSTAQEMQNPGEINYASSAKLQVVPKWELQWFKQIKFRVPWKTCQESFSFICIFVNFLKYNKSWQQKLVRISSEGM